MPEKQEEEHPPRPETLALLRIIPKFGPVAAQYMLERYEYQTNRAQEFMDEVTRTASLDVEDLFERLRIDPRLAAMFDQAVERAVADADARKRKALARAVATGTLAGDDAQVDVAQLVVSTLTNLQPAHAKFLDLLWRIPRESADSRPAPTGAVDTKDLEARWPGIGSNLGVVAAQLIASALIVDLSLPTVPIERPRYVLSPFGEMVCRYLNDSSAEHGDGPP